MIGEVVNVVASHTSIRVHSQPIAVNVDESFDVILNIFDINNGVYNPSKVDMINLLLIFVYATY